MTRDRLIKGRVAPSLVSNLIKLFAVTKTAKPI
jgi:hypothetical protein